MFARNCRPFDFVRLELVAVLAYSQVSGVELFSKREWKKKINR
jgi:hypothetical protein